MGTFNAIYCKSLWIHVSARCINVNVNNQTVCPFFPKYFPCSHKYHLSLLDSWMCLMITKPYRLRAVRVCVSTGLMWRWERCRLADDHHIHARGVSGGRWRGGREQQVGLGLLAQTVVVQRPRRMCVLQGLWVLVLRIRQQWAFCTTWNHKQQVCFNNDPNMCLWLPYYNKKQVLIVSYNSYYGCDYIIILIMNVDIIELITLCHILNVKMCFWINF